MLCGRRGAFGAAKSYPEIRDGCRHRRRIRHGCGLPSGGGIATIQGIKSSASSGRTKELIILEQLLGSVSDKLIITTDDGSAGKKGLVTDALRELVQQPDGKVNAVYCAGPVIMMKAISEFTRPLNIPTIVSLNPVMVDGTGMCGGCRVTIEGKRKFACVDGPEFDGHKVDFDELMDRLRTYKGYENKKYEEHRCKISLSAVSDKSKK